MVKGVGVGKKGSSEKKNAAREKCASHTKPLKNKAPATQANQKFSHNNFNRIFFMNNK